MGLFVAKCLVRIHCHPNVGHASCWGGRMITFFQLIPKVPGGGGEGIVLPKPSPEGILNGSSLIS